MMVVSDQLIGAAIAQSRELLLLLDPKSLNFVYSNSAAETALGYADGEICELSPHDLFPEFSVPELTAILDNLSSSDHKSMTMNTVLVSKLAGMRDYSLQLQCVEIDQKDMILVSGHDVTERMAETDQMHEMLAEAQMDSMLDPATGLLQRVYFLPYMHGVMSKALETKKPFGLMLLDLENMADINEKYGQPAGERVLLHIGQIVKRVVEMPEYAARFSGKKLCLLLPLATKGSVQELVSHLMRAIARLSYPEWPELKVKARMGIYFGNPEVDPEVLLERVGTEYRDRRLQGDEVLTLLNPKLDT
ncbi:GGDEF domain-containing protein [Oceanospirillum sanctuarii]|uniref:GGDEF domain-containing protein n=1 Tax=Oceanospirillum sanctuarii TaxID=1434821 RepID=UPI000A3609E2|nr:GGDEF domain-containing protein [Oceanospirillum sanctuarii]